MDEPRNHSYAPMVPTQLNALKQKLESFKLAENITEQDLQGLLEDWYAAESEWLVAGEYSSGLLADVLELSYEQASVGIYTGFEHLNELFVRSETLWLQEFDDAHKAFLNLNRVFREYAEFDPDVVIPNFESLVLFWDRYQQAHETGGEDLKASIVRLYRTFAVIVQHGYDEFSIHMKPLFCIWKNAKYLWQQPDEYTFEAIATLSEIFALASLRKPSEITLYLEEHMLLLDDANILVGGAERKIKILNNLVMSFAQVSVLQSDLIIEYVAPIFNKLMDLELCGYSGDEFFFATSVNVLYIFENVKPEVLPGDFFKFYLMAYIWSVEYFDKVNYAELIFASICRLLNKHKDHDLDDTAFKLLNSWFDKNSGKYEISKSDCHSLVLLSLSLERWSGGFSLFVTLLSEFDWSQSIEDGCAFLNNFLRGFGLEVEKSEIAEIDFPSLSYVWEKTVYLRDGTVNSLHSVASVSALAEYLYLAAFFSKRYPNKLTVNDALNIIEVNFYDYENLHADQVKRAIQNYWFAIPNFRRAGLISIYDLRIRIIPKWFLQNKFWNARAFENLLLLLSGDGSHARLLSFIPYCTLFFPSSNRTTLSIALLSALENGNPIESAFRRSFLPKKLIITAEECCNLINRNSDDLIKNSEISLRKQRCLACPLALYMSRFIAEACAYSSRPGYFIPDLDYLLLFRGALLLKPLHCQLSPLRMLLRYSLDIEKSLIAISESERGLQALRDARFVFDYEVGELLPVNLWTGGLHQVWARYRFNQRLKQSFPVLMEQNQRHHKAITSRIADGARCLVFWLADAVQRLTQLEVLGSDVDFELSDLIRWHMGRGTSLETWPWVSYASCQQAVAMMHEQGAEVPNSVAWLTNSEGNYEALKSAFTRLVRQSHRVAALSKVLETTERESEQSRSPNACLDALSEQVKDEIAALPEDITQLHPIAYEVIDLGLEHLLRARTEQWVNQTLMFLLPDISAEGFWPAWVTMVDAVLSHPDLGVQELHPPELEEGLLAWVAAGLDDAQEDEKVWSLLMHQTAALDLLNAKLPNHYSSWVQDTDRILAEVFQKDETYHCDHNRTLWEPFEVWQVQLAKLMPALPTIAQVQEKLTATEAMVLLYEAKQALHALLVAKSSVSRIKLSDNWHECAEPLQAEFASGNNANSENNPKVIAAIEAGSQQAWAEHSAWHEIICNNLIGAIPEDAEHLYLLPGTVSNIPWEWALKKQGCASVTRLVSVPAFLASVSNDVTSTSIVQGHIEAQSLDPDFTAMRALWSQESAPVTSITETLLSLKEAQQLHYFGHGQTDANHGGGNYLSMASHKLFTRLLPLTDINAGVINLSACYSAQSKHSIGLGHVLVGSGASHVIGCLWRAEAVSLYCFNRLLRDLSKNSHLTKAVFEQAQQRLSQLTFKQVKDWVAEAKSEQLNNNASYMKWLDINEIQPIFAHPYFWAGYVWLDRG